MIRKIVSHYLVIDKLGGGGMGVVYKAKDSRLGRFVALKFLPEDLAKDPVAVERFEREARAASALNHPHICTVYDIGVHEGSPYIAMEFLEGDTLAHRISRTPFKMDEVIELGTQIADALERAHAKGIIHRDIKPANVFVTREGLSRILDFGLAKLTQEHSPGRPIGASQVPTVAPQEPLTERGATLGTVAYMSPEQARGEPLDARTDLFSFGALLYEMITGRQAFPGNTTAVIFNAILEKEPPPATSLRPETPSELVRIVSKALEKDREVRYQSAADLRADLKRLTRNLQSGRIPASAATTGGVAPPLYRRQQAMVVAGVTGLALLLALSGFLVVRQLRSRTAEVAAFPGNATFTKLTSQPGPELFPSLSPDGRTVVFASRGSGNWDIQLQRVGGENPINLTKDSPADDKQPSFSPNGDQIAFRSERQGGGIFIMGATGESVRRLTDFGFNPAWSPDGKEILFATEEVLNNPRGRGGSSELWTVNLATEEKRRVSPGDSVQPQWSPHGYRIAYWAQNHGQRDIWTMPVSGGERVSVTNDAAVDWNPVWSPDGSYLYFSSDRGGNMNLWRVPVDERTGTTLGPAQPVTTGVTAENGHLSISHDGKRLAYSATVFATNIMKVAFDPDSKNVLGEPGFVTQGSLSNSGADPSPDGEWLAYIRRRPTEDIIVSRTDGSALRQLTNDAYNDRNPQWSPDGKKILFYSNRSGIYQLHTIGPDGSGLTQITRSSVDLLTAIWSPNGLRIAYMDRDSGSYILDTTKPWEDQKPLVLPEPGNGELLLPRSWSRDGKWLAGERRPLGAASIRGLAVYSFESGQYERLSDLGGFSAFTSDSRSVLFSAQDRIFIVDRVSKHLRELISNPSLSLSNPSVSRDGRTLFYQSTTVEADVWLITLP